MIRNIVKISLFCFLFVSCYYFVTKSNNQYIIEFEAKITQNNYQWLGEIYYNSEHSNIGIKRKDFSYEKVLNQFQKVRLIINEQFNIRYLRLDPLLNKGKIEIKNFTITLNQESLNIDFQKLDDNFYKNNIEYFVDQGILKIDSTGVDPFMDLSKDLQFNLFNLNYIFKTIILSVTLYMIIKGIKYLIYKYKIQSFILFVVIFIYSWYAILFSSWGFASNLLIFFGISSLILSLLIGLKYKTPYIRNVGVFLFIYLAICYLSIIFSTSYADLEYLNEKAPYIILTFLIPLGFYYLKGFNFNYFKIVLTSILFIIGSFIILLNFGIVNIHDVKIFDYSMIRTPWTQKNYMFWYVIFMFGVLSFYNLKEKIDFLLISLIGVFSYYVIFYGYSKSAMMAFSIGAIIYLILSSFSIKKKYMYILIWILTLYIIFAPLLLSSIDLSPYHQRLANRNVIYHTSAAFIKENWIFGYGYGSTLTVNVKDVLNLDLLPKNFINSFPGGHPHNLSLLFWLEFGVVGAIFLAYFIHKLLKFVIERTYNKISLAGLMAMFISFEIITSFSWSIWYPQVLLTFGFFGVMLMIGTNISKEKV